MFWMSWLQTLKIHRDTKATCRHCCFWQKFRCKFTQFQFLCLQIFLIILFKHSTHLVVFVVHGPSCCFSMMSLFIIQLFKHFN